MKRGLRQVHLAVRDALAKISTADGFYHDAPPILPRMVRPELGTVRPPYICLPLDDNGGYASTESDVFETTIHQPVVVVLGENSSLDFETCSAAEACNWHDDILHAIAPAKGSVAWDLGASAVVDDVAVTGKNLQSEPLDGFPPFVMVMLEIALRFTRENLGPQRG